MVNSAQKHRSRADLACRTCQHHHLFHSRRVHACGLSKLTPRRLILRLLACCYDITIALARNCAFRPLEQDHAKLGEQLNSTQEINPISKFQLYVSHLYRHHGLPCLHVAVKGFPSHILLKYSSVSQQSFPIHVFQIG